MKKTKKINSVLDKKTEHFIEELRRNLQDRFILKRIQLSKNAGDIKHQYGVENIAFIIAIYVCSLAFSILVVRGDSPFSVSVAVFVIVVLAYLFWYVISTTVFSISNENYIFLGLNKLFDHRFFVDLLPNLNKRFGSVENHLTVNAKRTSRYQFFVSKHDGKVSSRGVVSEPVFLVQQIDFIQCNLQMRSQTYHSIPLIIFVYNKVMTDGYIIDVVLADSIEVGKVSTKFEPGRVCVDSFVNIVLRKNKKSQISFQLPDGMKSSDMLRSLRYLASRKGEEIPQEFYSGDGSKTNLDPVSDKSKGNTEVNALQAPRRERSSQLKESGKVTMS